ncbi:MAG: tetratricopeptide repeat-containing sensor histidine kinase [Melioribacteraceae bacterium]|nr:tetratricopeptide repeat-containing sensor histidine kinase [Melioribacteraceae bacterium]
MLVFTLMVFIAIDSFGQVLPDSINKKLDGLSPTEQAIQLSKLSWLNREKDTDLAILLGEEAIKIGEQFRMVEDLGEFYNFVGVALIHYKHNIKESIPYFQKGLEYGLRANITTTIGYSYNNLGDAYYLTGNVPLALEYAELSMNIFQELNEPRGIAYSFINLGLVQRLNKNYNLSIQYFTEAVKIREKLDDKRGIASATLEIGLTYFDMGNYDSSKVYFQRSYELHSEIDNKMYIAYSLTGIGRIFLIEGNYEAALKLFTNAEKLNIERSHPFGTIDNKLGKAIVYSRTNNREMGEIEMDSALKIATEFELPTKILDVYKTYARFYMNMNDFQAASQSFTTFINTYDSLYSKQQFETLAEVQHRFLITQKLDSINQNLLLEENKSKTLFIVLILILLIALVIYWRFHTNRKLNIELTKLNESKDKLFSIIAHDLRSPFNVLLGSIDLLRREDISPAEKDESIQNVYNLTKNTYHLLENLLYLSAFRTGKIDYSPTNINLNQMIEDVLVSFSRQIKLKKIQIELVLKNSSFVADEAMLEIIMRNIVSNAIKFCKIGGVIRIESRKDFAFNYILIEDNGIGIDESIQNKLFTDEQIKSNRGTEGEKGTGLGLSLCKEFIERHDGSIFVESGLGTGTKVTIKLPINIK